MDFHSLLFKNMIDQYGIIFSTVCKGEIEFITVMAAFHPDLRGGLSSYLLIYLRLNNLQCLDVIYAI